MTAAPHVIKQQISSQEPLTISPEMMGTIEIPICDCVDTPPEFLYVASVRCQIY